MKNPADTSVSAGIYFKKEYFQHLKKLYSIYYFGFDNNKDTIYSIMFDFRRKNNLFNHLLTFY